MNDMEAWVAELELEVNPGTKMINNPIHQHNQCENFEASLAQQFSARIGESIPYLYSMENNISSPDEWDLDNIINDQYSAPLEISNNNNENCDESLKESQQKKYNNEVIDSKKQQVRGGAKRKRQPSQVQDHIIAERRRRELLSQLFISLSALVPGLKKMDKTSILVEAIKYVKQLQENIKNLKELVAKRAVESVVVIKKSQLVFTDNSGDDTDNSSSVVDVNYTNGDSHELDNVNDSLPEIEVKISSNKLLLKIYCENQDGIMDKLFRELEKHDLSVTNCNVVPFESLTIDITIVAQMMRGTCLDVRNFARNVRSALR